jgi:kynureninase
MDAVRGSMSVAEWHARRDEDASPSEWLRAAAKATGHAVDSAEFAAWLDESDPLRTSREKFHIPEHQPGQEQIYLCGNSLGPVPRATAAAVQAELQKWAMGGVSGHFTGELPWATCEEVLPALMAEVVGAEDAKLEVAAMNSLTVNLHMLMAAFYRPSAGRGAILIEVRVRVS